MATHDVEDSPLVADTPLVAEENQGRASPFRARLAFSVTAGLVCSALILAVFASSGEPESVPNPAVGDWKKKLAKVRTERLIDEDTVKSDAFEAVPPKILGRSKTDVGVFETWTFPLQFDSFRFYMRRFGVDMPDECLKGGCPLLVDFHGSYDSLFSQRAWTQWFKYQAKTKTKFVLLTPEGTPDAVMNPGVILNDCNTTAADCTGSSKTSWNVLGWGKTTKPVSKDEHCDAADKADGKSPICFWTTLHPDNAYPCYGTHLDADPTACHLHGNPAKKRGCKECSPQIPTVCQSASGGNDYDYMKQVMAHVVPHYKVDPERIYLSGQSMGGMSSLQWAMQSGPYDLGEYRPAAVAPCSAGASRSGYAQLNAEVPTLLMWGFEDSIAPVNAWGGYTRENEFLPKLSTFQKEVLGGDEFEELKKKALELTGGKMPKGNYMCKGTCAKSGRGAVERKFCCLILWANSLSGGRLLEGSAAHKSLEENNQLACRNDLGELTCLDGSAFMWEGTLTTLKGITGDHKLEMTDLEFKEPDEKFVPKEFQEYNDFLCATVPNKNDKDIRVCMYQGGHTYPWKEEWADDESNDWIKGAEDVLHDLVWKDFLKEGTVKRAAPAH